VGEQRCALIADDDEYFRIALRGILKQRLGFDEVLEAGSLEAALRALEANPRTQFAVFDLRMPGMASAASLQIVRHRFPELQVAVVSSSESRGDVLLALEARAHGYVPKGVGISELARALQTITEGQIYVPALLAKEEPEHAIIGSADQSEFDLTASQREFLSLLLRGS
jgi:DNA-binding NarL/FixJ family response regulator